MGDRDTDIFIEANAHPALVARNGYIYHEPLQEVTSDTKDRVSKTTHPAKKRSSKPKK